MATETNDKYPHKPSAKHTLEEVRKSLEDLVRNEFDEVEPAPQPADAHATLAAPEDDSTRRSLSNLPRRKPANLDTSQLLRSLKGLISDELSAGDGSAGAGAHEEAVSTASESRADNDAVPGTAIDTPATEAASAPTVPGPESQANQSVAARGREGEGTDEGEEITLDVPAVPEERGESPLEALEKVTESLGEARPSPGRRAPERTAPDTSGPTPALDSPVKPWSQLPLLKVVDLPETGGTQRAFVVQDPVFAADRGHEARPGKEHLADAVRVPQEPPMFMSQWLDEDPARQATDSELGLFAEESDAAMEPPSAPDPATPALDEAPTGDPQPAAPGPVKAAHAGTRPTGTDEETAGAEPASTSSADHPGWGEIDMLEIPGGDVIDEDTAEAEIILPAPEIDEPAAKSQLTLEAPEQTPMAHEIPSADPDERADIDLSTESADEPDTASDGERVVAEPSPPDKEQDTGAATSATTRAPEGARREVKWEHRTTLGQADDSFMRMTAIDFNAEPSPREEKPSGSAPEGAAPPLDPALDLPARPSESDVELPPPDEPRETVEAPPSGRTPLSLAEEPSPRVRFKAAEKETVQSKRPRSDSPQRGADTQRRPERRSAKPKSGKTELMPERDTSQQPAGQDIAEQTQPASSVPEWYRRPFKIEHIAPVKPAEPRAKAPSLQGRTRPKSPTYGTPDKIPVLDAVVTGSERPKAKAPARMPERERPKAKAPPKVHEREPSKANTAMAGAPVKATPPATPKAGRRDSAAARSLAIQIVAKLNMELRKCGERALSPAIVDRLQYLLREALAQGGSDVDNSKNKKP